MKIFSRYNRINEGTKRLLLVGSILIELIMAILIIEEQYIIESILGLIGIYILYWIIVFAILWIYDGFLDKKL